MPRINSIENLSELNAQLERIDGLQKQVRAAEQRINSLHSRVSGIENTHVPARSNSLIFTWSGAASTLSWPAGSVIDRSGVNVAVVAGSLSSLLPSTYYWLAWNPVHQQMTAQIGVNILLTIPSNIIICQLFTGTAGQSGIAGGGGSSNSTSDLTETRYKLF